LEKAKKQYNELLLKFHKIEGIKVVEVRDMESRKIDNQIKMANEMIDQFDRELFTPICEDIMGDEEMENLKLIIPYKIPLALYGRTRVTFKLPTTEVDIDIIIPLLITIMSKEDETIIIFTGKEGHAENIN
jgi:hypothetical protein